MLQYKSLTEPNLKHSIISLDMCIWSYSQRNIFILLFFQNTISRYHCFVGKLRRSVNLRQPPTVPCKWPSPQCRGSFGGGSPPTTTTKTLICPGWETAVVPVSQPGTPVRDKRGCPFVPGLATGTEEDLLSRLVTPTGTKGAASAHVAGAPFCPGWCLFFSCFPFLNSFSISIILLHFN